jgi:hypothetical protein
MNVQVHTEEQERPEHRCEQAACRADEERDHDEEDPEACGRRSRIA